MTNFLLDQAATSETTVKEANKLLDTIEGYIPKVIDFGVNIIIALVIFFIGKIIINWLLKVCNKFLEKAKVEISIRRFLKSLIRVVLYVILIIIICDRVGINTASFIAVLGTLGLTVGLALQGSLSNFAGGVLILILKPFKVGDYIIESAGGNEGTVVGITIFYTKLSTVDNKQILIPNGSLSNTTIVNVSAMENRKLDLRIGVSYEANLAKTKEVLRQVVDANELILKDEPIDIFVSELGESSVEMGVRVWVKNEDYWTLRWKMTEDIKNALDANEISIPYPQMDVHMK